METEWQKQRLVAPGFSKWTTRTDRIWHSPSKNLFREECNQWGNCLRLVFSGRGKKSPVFFQFKFLMYAMLMNLFCFLCGVTFSRDTSSIEFYPHILGCVRASVKFSSPPEWSTTRLIYTPIFSYFVIYDVLSNADSVFLDGKVELSPGDPLFLPRFCQLHYLAER